MTKQNLKRSDDMNKLCAELVDVLMRYSIEISVAAVAHVIVEMTMQQEHPSRCFLEFQRYALNCLYDEMNQKAGKSHD